MTPTESTGTWTELLGTLIKQGVKDVLLFVADGLVSLDEGLSGHFCDVVEIRQTRPISKTKSWALVRVVEKAPID